MTHTVRLHASRPDLELWLHVRLTAKDRDEAKRKALELLKSVPVRWEVMSVWEE